MTKLSRLFPSLLAFTLLLSPGCAALSESMDAYRNSYHGLMVYNLRMGIGDYGAMGITSIKFDERERVRSQIIAGGGKYNPTPQPFHPSWFAASEHRTFDFPHTIEVTWFIYGEQQLYHTTMTMPSYKELKKIMGVEKLPGMGLGLIFDMPPQVKCFVFHARPILIPWKRKQYHLAATGMGTPISGPLDRFVPKTRRLCKEGFLPEKVCAKYRTSDPDATKQ